MKKTRVCVAIIFFAVSICSPGCKNPTVEQTVPKPTPQTSDTNDIPETSRFIAANHSIVEDYLKIPERYLVEVKKMWVNILGESHSAAYRDGLLKLAELDPRFSVSVREDSPAESYMDTALRASRIRRSDYGSWMSWGTGEDTFWTTEAGSTEIKAHIKYCADNGYNLAMLGFGWCWDMQRGAASPTEDSIYGCRWYGSTDGGSTGWWGLDSSDSTISCDTYCKKIDEYNAYAQSSSYGTKVVFTTGTVDGYGESEAGYQGYLKNEYIRNYVSSNKGDRVLFDYADILCYDNAGQLQTSVWNGHTFNLIHPNNDAEETGHINYAGALRLAKAQWWLLARIAGWDGK